MKQQLSDQPREKQQFSLWQRYRAVIRVGQFSILWGLLIALCSLSLCVSTRHRSGNSPSTVLAYQLLRIGIPAMSTFTPVPTSTGTPKSLPTSSPLSTSDELQAIYDCLTLILVIASIGSIFLSRKQAKAALDESRKQSNAALNTAREQIEESKRQSQEILYNQNKPMLIWHTPDANSTSAKRSSAPDDPRIYYLDIENVGSGIATNIWSVLYMDQSLREPPFICAYSDVLIPNKRGNATFSKGIYTFKANEIEGYSFYPQTPEVFFRVVTTYVDVYDRKHLSVFDYERDNTWKQVRFLSGIKQTLEEMRVQ